MSVHVLGRATKMPWFDQWVSSVYFVRLSVTLYKIIYPRVRNEQEPAFILCLRPRKCRWGDAASWTTRGQETASPQRHSLGLGDLLLRELFENRAGHFCCLLSQTPCRRRAGLVELHPWCPNSACLGRESTHVTAFESQRHALLFILAAILDQVK